METKTKAVVFARVSTNKQETSLRLQERLCIDFCKSSGFDVVQVFKETASGASFSRPMFDSAVAVSLLENAVLVSTKIDRLSRRISAVGELIDRGVRICVVQLGAQEVNPLTLGIFASLAHAERNLISARTKEALAQLKREGVKLGNPNAKEDIKKAQAAVRKNARHRNGYLLMTIEEIRAAGLKTNEEIAHCLNVRGIRTARGKSFTAPNVARIRRTAA